MEGAGPPVESSEGEGGEELGAEEAEARRRNVRKRNERRRGESVGQRMDKIRPCLSC